MREASGTTTTLKMALAFTILFSAFLVVAITYNRAFKVKNEMLTILEKYEGPSVKSLGIINNYLKNNGYNGKGRCDSNEYGMLSLDSEAYESAKNNTDYYYCISYYCSIPGCSISKKNNIYYKIRVFFKFNLPFLGDLTTFKIEGETKPIKLFDEWQRMGRK